MFSLSYLVAILLGIIFIGLGWLANHLMNGGKAQEYKTKFVELEKENKNQGKVLNKEKKLVDQLRQKSESWKHEFQALTKDNHSQKKEMEARIGETNEKYVAVSSELKLTKTEMDRSITALEKLKKDHVNLREKYKRDVADGKEWRTERQKFERDLKDVTSKLEKTSIIAEEYKGKYADQAAEINKIRVMQREMRVLNTKTKKLEEDCTYWEKKHYDIHHELAQLKTKSESLVSQYNELKSLRQGDEILKDNLKIQIQEFKTKFVNINNKYRDLVKNN